MSQLGGVLLYGNAEAEIPLLKNHRNHKSHSNPNTHTHTHTNIYIYIYREREREREREVPAAVHATHGGVAAAEEVELCEVLLVR